MLHPTALQPFHNAAGHGGVMSDDNGEIVVKPCTQAEIDFYNEANAHHAEFAAYIPTFMGTLTLGSPELPDTGNEMQLESTRNSTATTHVGKGKEIKTDIAIVLENLEYGFTKPSVIDIKLGAKLCAPGTAPEKVARLDKVASETTTGLLHFRIAGMKVWNPEKVGYDYFDKDYGRIFDEHTIIDGFTTFFHSVISTQYSTLKTAQIIAQALEELEAARRVLEQEESRFYSSSVLIVFEGDVSSLQQILHEGSETRQALPTKSQAQTTSTSALSEDEDEDEDEINAAQPAFRLKLIDFAHSSWCPGAGKDMNVITGLLNIEKQLRSLLEKVVPHD